MLHLLIIEDDEDDRDLFCDAIHEIEPQIKCILARNGEEALTGLRLDQFPKPKLIFLDLNMPRKNGFQCLRELKGDRLLRDIPVVIYTTSKSIEQKTECEKLGAVHFITKPTSFNELCRVISNVLYKEMIIHD
jgi:CheY-like chemotaxis protein